MTVQETQELIAVHQANFRSANDKIHATAVAQELAGQLPFICECADPTCRGLVQLSAETYQAVRRHPRGFFNISGHEASSVAAGAERVVAVMSELTLVMKIGAAGELAVKAATANEASQGDSPLAAQRERVADQRDRVADQRDRVADQRDQVADERDRKADRREGAD
jgi:hypothetical protein